MLPLAQVSRKGSSTVVWGQVRPGSGTQQYVLRFAVAAGLPLGGVRRTASAGTLVQSVTAPAGSQLRLWYPARRIAGTALLVR